MLANLHSLFFDERYWGDPENFRPERYINLDGSLNKDMLQRVIMYGIGKHVSKSIK